MIDPMIRYNSYGDCSVVSQRQKLKSPLMIQKWFMYDSCFRLIDLINRHYRQLNLIINNYCL